MKITYSLLIVAIVCLLSSNSFSQTLEESIKKVSFGASFGVGYINPKQINERIQDHYNNESSIHLAYTVEVNTSYFVTEKIEVKGALLGSLAYTIPKDAIGSTEDKFTILTRIAPEIIGNYHFPFDYYNALYVGGGISYNRLSFNMDLGDEADMKETTPGLVFNVGVLTKTQKTQKYLELKVNLISVKSYYSEYYVSTPVEMNFSGINLNFGIKF